MKISRSRLTAERGRIDNAVLKNYGETLIGGASGTNTTSSYTVDLASGNVFHLILNANCTFTFSNTAASTSAVSFTLILKQDTTGTRTATWPAAVIWPGNIVPTLTTTVNRADVFSFLTTDGGTTWLGFVGGQNFAWGVPDVPTSLTATAGDTEVDLAWNAPTSDGGSAITGYKVYRDTASPATTLIDTIGVTTSYNDTGRTNGTEYFYRVKATNALGDSDYSNEDSAVPMSMAFQASASSTAADGTITIPADSAVGDLAVLFDRTRNSSGVPTDVIPTNWTGLVTATDSNVRRIRCSYKVLVSGDPGASITGCDGSADNRKQMVVFRPSSTITTVTPSTWLAQMTDGNPASQAVSASGQAVPLVVLGYNTSDNSTAFSTASPAFDATVAAANGTVGYKIYNSAPADHTIDMNDLGVGNSLSSGYLIVS